MKITNRQLRRIVKEEKAKVLAEQKVRRVVRNYLLRESHLLRENHPVDAHLMQTKKGFDKLMMNINQLAGQPLPAGVPAETADIARDFSYVLKDEFKRRPPKGGKEGFQALLDRIPDELKAALAIKMDIGSPDPQAGNDGRTVTGTHGGKSWSVRIPDNLADAIIKIHQVYLADEDANAPYDLVSASDDIDNFVQAEVEKQLGVSIPNQNYDSIDESGLDSDLADAIVDAASEE